MKRMTLRADWLAPLCAAISLAAPLDAVPAPPVEPPPPGAGCEIAWLPNPAGQPGVNSRVNALTIFDDGDGPALYAGGLFTAAGDVTLNYVGKWDGAAWSPLGSGVNNEVYTLVSFDDGDGPALYAGGVFSEASGEVVNRIAKWDGETWSALGTGLSNSPLALAVYDDGSGEALFVGGQFTTASGVTVNRIAKWDGDNWSPLGTGLNSEARALIVYDDGAGASLYVGGTFTTAGGEATSLIAKWDGTTWSPVGPGLGGVAGASVNAMTIYDDGCGPALYVGGGFMTDGESTLDRIARWDGNDWYPLGTGVSSTVQALFVFDSGLGGGPVLYVGGFFTSAGGVSAHRVATWNGTIWSALGPGWTQAVLSLQSFDDGLGGGAKLHAGGWFSSWPAGSGYLALLEACPPDPLIPGDLNGNGTVDVTDLLSLLGQWGDCSADPCPPSGGLCIADLNEDDTVNVVDLLIILGNWG